MLIPGIKFNCKDAYIPITYNTEISYNYGTGLPDKGVNFNLSFGILPNLNLNAGLVQNLNFLKLGTTISMNSDSKNLFNFSLAEIDLFTFLDKYGLYKVPKNNPEISDDILVKTLVFLLNGNYSRFVFNALDYKEGGLFDYKMNWLKLGIGIGRYSGEKSLISYSSLFFLNYTKYKPGRTLMYYREREQYNDFPDSVAIFNTYNCLEFGFSLATQLSFSRYFSICLNIDYAIIPFTKRYDYCVNAFADFRITFFKTNELALSVPVVVLFFRAAVNESNYAEYANINCYRLGISFPLQNTSMPFRTNVYNQRKQGINN